MPGDYFSQVYKLFWFLKNTKKKIKKNDILKFSFIVKITEKKSNI